MAKIPTFNHPQLKQLAEAVAETMELHGGRGVLVRKVPNGWQLETAADASELSLPRRTVALVGKPETLPLEEQQVGAEEPLVVKPLALFAREVRYKSLPPLAPDTQQDGVVDHLAAHKVFPGYEFAGGEFRVYPAIGWSVTDYEGFIVGPDDTLDRTQAYFFAYLEDNIWVLEHPAIESGGLRYAYVRATVDTKPEQVLVQFIESATAEYPGENDTTVTREEWSNSGEPRVAHVPAQFLATDFEKLKRTSLSNKTPIVECKKMAGKWRINLRPRWAYSEPPPLASIVRC